MGFNSGFKGLVVRKLTLSTLFVFIFRFV